MSKRVTIFSWPGTLCEQAATGSYDLVGTPNAFTLCLEEQEKTSKTPRECFLVVRLDGEAELEQPVHVALGVNYHTPSGFVCWCSVVDGNVKRFGFRFSPKKEDPKKNTPEAGSVQFVQFYDRLVYSVLMDGSAPGESDDEDYLASAGCLEIEKDRREEVVFAFDGDAAVASTGPGSNTCFAESVQYHRAIVLQERQGKVVAQAHAFGERGFTGQQQEFVVPTLTYAKEALLQHGDSRMFVVDTSGKSTLEGQLKELDLQAGQVVQTYQPAPGSSSILSAKYFAKCASESPNLLSCITANSAFVIDTRMDPTKCAVVDEGKDLGDYSYASLAKQKNAFTCHATSRNGYLAVGDVLGGVRLYTGPPGAEKKGGGHHAKLAKTLIELHVPILFLDITSDGEFVIVTTKERVLVLCTLYADDKSGVEKNGFEGRMGKKKPAPLVLLPSPEQVAHMGGPSAISFSKATLEQNDAGEQWIAAACGTALCMWSMSRVRDAVKVHAAVYCEGKDMKERLLSVDIPGGTSAVGFLTTNTVGLQKRTEGGKKRSTGFTFYDEQ